MLNTRDSEVNNMASVFVECKSSERGMKKVITCENYDSSSSWFLEPLPTIKGANHIRVK